MWKLDDDEDEYIDADDLLIEDDIKKPDPSLLKGIISKINYYSNCVRRLMLQELVSSNINLI